MEALLFVPVAIVVIAIIVFAIWASSKAMEKWRDTLQDVAEQLGLEYDPGTWLRKASSAGAIGDHQYKLDSYTVSTGKSSQTFTRIILDVNLPSELELKKEGLLSGFAKAFVGEDVQVGIEHFDEKFLLKGRRDVAVLARLGYRSRVAMAKSIGTWGVKVRKGQIEWVEGGLISDADKLMAVSRAMIELADALTEFPSRPATALLHHAFNDKHPQFRRRALEALLTELGRSEEAAAALKRAAQDPDPGIRFLAARQQGEAGLSTIHALLGEQGLPAEMREEAAALLGPRFGGGLSLSADGQAGELSMQRADEGALSEAAEPARVRRKKQTQ